MSKVTSYKEDIAVLKMESKINREEHKELKEILTSFIETADSKYSSKWVERAVLTIGLFMITAIIGFFISNL